MARTPDRSPWGPAREEEIIMEDRAADGDPTDVGGIRFVNGSYRMRDAQGVFNPRNMTEVAHQAIRQLIHFVDEGPANGFLSRAFKEVLPAGSPFPTSIAWYEDASKAKKLVEKLITRSGGGATNIKPTPITWKIYDIDGATVLGSVTDTIAYTGAFESSRIRTIS